MTLRLDPNNNNNNNNNNVIFLTENRNQFKLNNQMNWWRSELTSTSHTSKYLCSTELLYLILSVICKFH